MIQVPNGPADGVPRPGHHLLNEVVIDTVGPKITVKAHAPLDVVAATAIKLLTEAKSVCDKPPLAPGVGFGSERRSTPDHTDPNYRSNRGFGPVKA